MLTGLSVYLPESLLTVFDNLDFLIRIVLAAILGALVGLERTKQQKDAGIRTHCIVALTSAVFMILSKYAFIDVVALAGSKGADPSRIASQVVTGISFLGAGVIFKNANFAIKGLTTAAGMWATSAIGMAIGAGLYWVGLVGTAVLMCVQLVLHRFPIGSDAVSTQELSVRMRDRQELLDAFEGLIRAHRGQIIESNISREEDDICLEVVAKLPEPITHDEAIAFMKAHSDVTRISV